MRNAILALPVTAALASHDCLIVNAYHMNISGFVATKATINTKLLSGHKLLSPRQRCPSSLTRGALLPHRESLRKSGRALLPKAWKRYIIKERSNNDIISLNLSSNESDDAKCFGNIKNNKAVKWQQYFSMMRPITIIQAVGAFLVGRLVILSQQHPTQATSTTTMDIRYTVIPLIMASLSIYLSYGAGMAMNDCADAKVDSLHEVKQSRSIASSTISIRDGWVFCVATSILSIVFAWLANSMTFINEQGATMVGFGSSTIGYGPFVIWTIINLLLMAGYALGMQKLFLIKNILCGFFAISPLVGAGLLPLSGSSSTTSLLLGSDVTMKLYQLAAIGFPLQISREILKDIEDVEVDRGEKQTLPLVIGSKYSKRIAYGLVGIVNAAMIFSPYYWKMFASTPPVYAISVAVGTPMCIVASRLELSKGQKLLKKSIYVLLMGMISGLLLQS